MDVLKKHSPARRLLIGIGGGSVLIAGIAMIVLPGPAFVAIPAGLAILATEFDWARKWMHKTRNYFREKLEQKRKAA